MKQSKALVMLSGGLDSATCLFWAKEKFSNIYAITFNYHDRIDNEKKATIELAKKAKVTKLFEIDIPFIKESSDFYNGQYTSLHEDRRWSSYIPARNMIFYSIAAHYAEFLDVKWIIGGHNSEDGSFFRDATSSYIQKINSLFSQGCLYCNERPYMIIIPLAEMDRRSIINLAIRLNVPLALTWSCHTKGEIHCGQCYACIQRSEAFRSLGISDPAFIEKKHYDNTI
ncbi:MAG TPA: 7-cyano-7-deazaguanine synthase [Nitrososphaeraceae archaeon]|jgi:7-cyano-7-deazaguanine synthase